MEQSSPGFPPLEHGFLGGGLLADALALHVLGEGARVVYAVVVLRYDARVALAADALVVAYRHLDDHKRDQQEYYDLHG